MLTWHRLWRAKRYVSPASLTAREFDTHLAKRARSRRAPIESRVSKVGIRERVWPKLLHKSIRRCAFIVWRRTVGCGVAVGGDVRGAVGRGLLPTCVSCRGFVTPIGASLRGEPATVRKRPDGQREKHENRREPVAHS
jgi:hypothetical protein